MIFITLGSQKFQFNRLLEEIDRLIEAGRIIEDVFAQIGYSDYQPKNYQYSNFLDRNEFSTIMKDCTTVITHGGTGAIITAIKNRKKVIGVPRLKEFSEHVDNHQLEIVEIFSSMNFIIGIKEIKELEKVLEILPSCEFNEYQTNTYKIIESIEDFINS